MGKKDQVTFSFRIDAQDYEKIRCIAKEEKRSINAQLEVLVRNAISKYERDHGEIDTSPLFDD